MLPVLRVSLSFRSLLTRNRGNAVLTAPFLLQLHIDHQSLLEARGGTRLRLARTQESSLVKVTENLRRFSRYASCSAPQSEV